MARRSRTPRFGTPRDTCATPSNRAMWLQPEEDRPMLRTLLPASTLLCAILLPLAGHPLNQPTLPRNVWEEVVDKMINVYKAPITPQDAATIVDYLARTKGPT